MSHASDDPPSDRISARAASAAPAASGEGEAVGSARPRLADEEANESTNPQSVTGDNGGASAPPRPGRRRRRRRPREAGIAKAITSGPDEHEERGAADGASQPGELPAEPSGGGDIPRRRRP